MKTDHFVHNNLFKYPTLEIKLKLASKVFMVIALANSQSSGASEVNSKIFHRILFSRKALKDIFAT